MCSSKAIGTTAFLAIAWTAFTLDVVGLLVGTVAAGLPYWMITDAEMVSRSAAASLHNNTAILASGLWVTAVLITPPINIKPVMVTGLNNSGVVETWQMPAAAGGGFVAVSREWTYWTAIDRVEICDIKSTAAGVRQLSVDLGLCGPINATSARGSDLPLHLVGAQVTSVVSLAAMFIGVCIGLTATAVPDNERHIWSIRATHACASFCSFMAAALVLSCVSVYTAWPYHLALHSEVGAPVFVTDAVTGKLAVVNQHMKPGIAIMLMSSVFVIEVVAAVLHVVCALVKSSEPYVEVKEKLLGDMLEPIKASSSTLEMALM